ncbi:hypothetical protein QO011_005861 [Labrys wisconsinensis]|uniref:YcfA n=1 Tax=Labrys wisconsinensis TaxID=425677 RepID=A0ABU0JH77_9HYPH|nr:hypothetical protein [Labrys wisconsinensis]
MNRDQFIASLRRHARKKKIFFSLNTRKGKGSHYIVTVGDFWTTVQYDLDEGSMRRCLKQLNISPADL